MRYLTLLVVLLATGCGSIHEVAECYRPLECIRESVLQPGAVITTIGKTAYVNDLDKWLDRHPPNTRSYRAILLHEQVHSKRQLDYGLMRWLVRYAADRKFMWDEESRGWYVQLTTDPPPSVDAVAKILSSYFNAGGQMISYEDALQWVTDVLAGWWHPEDD